MTETQPDVFLSHNSKDKNIVTQIASALVGRGLDVWLDDWSIQPGTRFQKNIGDALTRCGAVAVFISPNNVGRWEEREIEIAIQEQARREKLRVIPVFLPGITDEQISQIPPFLGLYRWVDYRSGSNAADALDRLVWGITGVKPILAHPQPHSESASERPPHPATDDVISSLVELLKSQNITFFLGAGASYNEQIDAIRYCDIARELLVDLSIIQRPYDELLPPVDVAGLYYAVNRGDQRLEDKVIDLMTGSPQVITQTHEKLASLLGLLTRRPVRRRRAEAKHLVVTTSIDLSMERAFLSAGLPFTRIVQHRSGQQIDINEYRSVQLLDGPVIQLPPHAGQIESVRCSPMNLGVLDSIIERYGKRVVRDSQDALVGKGNQLNSLAVQDMTEPILYKFLGSLDIPNSAVLTTSHYFEFARRIVQQNCIPEQITAIIGSSTSLLTGLWFMDADFRLLYHSLLRRAVEIGTDSRYALQLPPDTFKRDVYRKMETGIWESIKDAGMLQHGIKTIEEQSEVFLQKLIERIQGV
jgi:hypothetical protein